MTRRPAANPHDARMQATADRLRAALARLTASSGAAVHLTVAALAREAGVGRNAIYANHRDILDDLARARQRQLSPDSRPAKDRITEQRRMIDDMQHQLRQLATENAGLLRRAIEAERRVDRAERRSAQLTKEIGSLQRPMMLRPQQEDSGQG